MNRLMGGGGQELDAYEAEYQQHPLATEAEATPLQEQPTAAQLGLLPADDLRNVSMLATRIRFLNSLTSEVGTAAAAVCGRDAHKQ